MRETFGRVDPNLPLVEIRTLDFSTWLDEQGPADGAEEER